MARIEAELFNRPLNFPAEVASHPQFVANQRQLYNRRREALRSSLASLESMVQLARQELAMNQPLLETGDVSRSEILRMQRAVADLQGQMSSRRNDYLQELQAEYAATEEELATLEQQLTQRRSALEGAELRSPVDGVVVNSKVTTVGGVIRPGDEVLQIVPSADRLIVEARLSPAEIAFVRVGQPASLKFDAYDSAIYGAGEGRVSYVSADTLSEQTPQGAQSYYIVHLNVDASMLRPRPGELIALQPGMTATAEIVTGESTVFNYLMKPILKTASESLGER
jgi:adhesin transport system membrane fusion protein